MPATQDRNTPRRENVMRADPAAAVIFAGTLYTLNAAGQATPAKAADTKPVRAVAQAYAAATNCWFGVSVPAQCSRAMASGVIGPHGRWLARCPDDGTSDVVVAELDRAALQQPDVQDRIFRLASGLDISEAPASSTAPSAKDDR